VLIYFTPGEGKSEHQGEAPLRSLTYATTGGVPHSIPEGDLKFAKAFILGIGAGLLRPEAEAALGFRGKLAT
jgi:hypothetical protein